MKWLILSFLSSACVSSQTHIIQDREPATIQVEIPENLKPDLAIIEKYLSARMQVLDREILTFHYEGASFRASSLLEAQNRIYSWTENYFNIDKTGGGYEQGPGEYTAVDVSASREFGNQQPKLYVLPLRKGTRVLNLAAKDSVQEKSDLYATFTKNQCLGTTTAFPDDVGTVIGDMRRSDGYQKATEAEINCRKLIVRAAQDLGWEAIAYEYPASTTLDGCRAGRSIAFNIVKNSAINYDHLAYYDDNVKFNASSTEQFLARMYEEGKRDFATRLRPEARAGIHSWLFDSSESEYSAWKSKNIFGCGRATVLETRPFPAQIKNSISGAFKDHELISALAKFRDAILAHGQRLPPDLTYLHAIEAAIYDADRSSNFSFADFQAAHDKVTIDFTKQFILLESMKKPLSPESLRYAFIQMGFKGSALRLATSNLLLSLDLAPMLEGKTLTPATMQKNRRHLLQILLDCTAAYSDTHANIVADSNCFIRPSR